MSLSFFIFQVVETLFPAGTAIPAEVTRVVTKQPNGKPPIVYSVQQVYEVELLF